MVQLHWRTWLLDVFCIRDLLLPSDTLLLRAGKLSQVDLPALSVQSVRGAPLTQGVSEISLSSNRNVPVLSALMHA